MGKSAVVLRHKTCTGAIVWLLLLFSTSCFGFANNKITAEQVVSLDKGLVPEVKILALEREPQSSQLEQLLSDIPLTSASSPNYGFSTKSYWIAFALENQTANRQQLLLEVAYSMLDQVIFQAYDAQTDTLQSEFVTGDQYKFHERPVLHPNFVFPLAIEAQQKLKLLIRIKTGSSSQFPLKLWSQGGLTRYSQTRAAAVGAMVGIILVLAVYNLLLFFSLNDISYLFMAFTLTGYAAVEAILTGYAYFYAWPFSPMWQDMSLTVVSNFALANLCLFSRSFLSLQTQHPKFGAILLATALCSIGLALASTILPYRYMIIITAVNVVVAPAISYSAGLYLTLKRYKPAYFYTTAFLVFVISAAIFVLGKMGIVARTGVTEYSIHVGATLTVVLLSFALADRIKREKAAREMAQEVTIANLKKYRKIYESSLEGMLRVSLKGDLIACNPAFAKLMGAKDEEELVRRIGRVSDYLPNSDESLEDLVSALRKQGHVFGFETECKRLDGSIFWGALYAKYIDDEHAGEFIDASIVDITDKKLSEEKLNFIATHDPLTGVANRAGFERQLNLAILSAREHAKVHSLLFMDLDQFKVVNDSCGHGAGDELLKQLSALFRGHIRDLDSIARIGGDEFVILLNECQLDKATEIANRLRQEVYDYKFSWQAKIFSVGVSIGIVPVNSETKSSSELLNLADAICYAAKEGGRNRVVVHEEKLTDLLMRQTELGLAKRVQEAIDGNRLILYKQDIKPLKGSVDGDIYEVFVRLPSQGKLVFPGGFIPALERFDSLTKLDIWVIENYLKWLCKNPEALTRLAQANINISVRSLEDDGFERYLLETFPRYRIPKDRVCFEITECETVSNFARANESLKRLAVHGFRFSLDDFGSGFSSYTYLKMLPLTSLKIDSRLVQSAEDDPVDAAMIRSVIEVAHTMGLEVIAEFVESESAYRKLAELGVDYAQGYYLHEPEELDAAGPSALPGCC